MLILLITSLRRGDALLKEVKAKIDRQARIDAQSHCRIARLSKRCVGAKHDVKRSRGIR